MWDVILFDLDGTITDPKEGITKSVAHALRHFGIHVADPDTLTPFIGPPLMGSFQKFYQLSAEQAQEALRVYRERFSAVGWAEYEAHGADYIAEELSRLQELLLGCTE